MDSTVTAARRLRTTEVGVLDKLMSILGAVEGGAGTTNELVEATGLSRTTLIRMAEALELHGLLGRADGRRWRLGPRLVSLGSAAVSGASYTEALREAAHPALTRLTEATGESAQLYVRIGDRRVCIASSQSENELRTIVEVGAALPLTAGSAGKVFLGHGSEAELQRLLEDDAQRVPRSKAVDRERFERQVFYARRRGWAQSVGEREEGVASVSAPVLDALGSLAAVVSVSGPVQRLGRRPGQHYGPAVVQSARSIERALGFERPPARETGRS
jgi:DNA-binding IclR family transcriptional regulator